MVQIFWRSMILFRKPVSTFRDHALERPPYLTLAGFAIRNTLDSRHVLCEKACQICDRKRADVSRTSAYRSLKYGRTVKPI